MGITEILHSIDQQIIQLQRVRALLGGTRGRDGNGSQAASGPAKRKKRRLTPEGRKRIAEAVKRRWERHRKAAAAGQK